MPSLLEEKSRDDQEEGGEISSSSIQFKNFAAVMMGHSENIQTQLYVKKNVSSLVEEAYQAWKQIRKVVFF